MVDTVTHEEINKWTFDNEENKNLPEHIQNRF